MRVVNAIVRFEWAVVAALAIVLFGRTGGSWIWFAVLILSPDLSILGYLAGPRVGAICYNALHNLVLPGLLLLAGMIGGVTSAILVGLIWVAHIAIDRTLGYGLKLPDGFKHTHMSAVRPTD